MVRTRPRLAPLTAGSEAARTFPGSTLRQQWPFEDGTGEIIFSLAGVRRCAGARTDEGKAIEKGAEVVIERYEKGIAYVKKWEEFTK